MLWPGGAGPSVPTTAVAGPAKTSMKRSGAFYTFAKTRWGVAPVKPEGCSTYRAHGRVL